MHKLLLWTKRVLVLALLSAVGFYVVVFTLNNTAKVSVDFLIIQWLDVPIELVMVVSFVVGGLFGCLCTLGLWLRCKGKLNKAQLELNKLSS